MECIEEINLALERYGHNKVYLHSEELEDVQMACLWFLTARMKLPVVDAVTAVLGSCPSSYPQAYRELSVNKCVYKWYTCFGLFPSKSQWHWINRDMQRWQFDDVEEEAELDEEEEGAELDE